MENESKASLWQKIVESAEHAVAFAPYLILGASSVNIQMKDDLSTKGVLNSAFIFANTHLAFSAATVGLKVISSIFVEKFGNLENKILDTAVSGALVASTVMSNLDGLNSFREYPIIKLVLGYDAVLKSLALTNAISVTVAADKIGKYFAGNWESFGKPVVITETISQFPAQTFKYSMLGDIKSGIGVGENSLTAYQAIDYGSSVVGLGGLTYNIKKATSESLDYMFGECKNSTVSYNENFIAGALNYGLYQIFDRYTTFPAAEHEIAALEREYKKDVVLYESIAAGIFENIELLCQESKICEFISSLTSGFIYFE